MSAQEYKDLGNKAFQAAQYAEAIQHYSNAIALEENHVFYSNRSGAYLAIGQFQDALEDADQCIQLSPSFVKGYTRRAAALEAMSHWKDAAAAYDQALKLDPGNSSYRASLADCWRRDQPPQPTSQSFSLVPPDYYQRLSSNPSTKALVENKAIREALDNISKDPMSFTKYQDNPGVMVCIQSLLGITPEMQQAMAQQDHEAEQKKKRAEEDLATRAFQTPSMARDTTSVNDLNKNKEEPAEEEYVDEELEREKAERREKRANADKIKEEGAVHYKKREFEPALAKFKEAAEADDTNPVYLMNVAAVQFELQAFDDCIASCHEALKVSGISPAQKGKCYTRIAHAYSKQKKFEDAVQMFKRSILEDNVPATRQGLRQAEIDLKQWKIEQYYDDAKSEEAKTEGNAAYAAGDYAKAIDFYTDALKRNPNNYKVYSNRALCYIKVAMWEKGLEDCDKCLTFDPKFSRALVRKGKIHHFLKAYHKAITCFEEVLKNDPNDQEAMEGLANTQRAIYSTHDSTPGGDEARLAEAMKDPEVLMAMNDPKIQKLLQDMQANPEAAMKAFQDPAIAPLLQKLVAAGIIKLG